MPIINVTIIEHDKEHLEYLKAALYGPDSIKLVGAYMSGKSALTSMSNSPPDVAIVGLPHPDASGVSIVTKIKEFSHSINILVLTNSNDDKHLLSALKAGAAGHTLKGARAKGLIKAIDEVYKGNSPMSGNITRRVLQEFHKFDEEKRSLRFELSSREKEVLSQLAKGHKPKKIGLNMAIEYESVRSHLKHIYKKLEAHSMHEALVKAKEKGLV